MNQLTSFFSMQCVVASRSKQALFWSFMYPLLMLILMMSVFGGMLLDPEAVGGDTRLTLVAGVVVITVMSGGLFAIVTVIPADLCSGVYKRLKVTDLSSIHVVSGLILRQVLITILGSLLVVIAARFLFSASINGNGLSLLLTIFIGTVMFCSLGFLIVRFCEKPQTAIAVGNVVFLIMLFLSGSTFPKTLFPHWLDMISRALPASYLYDVLEAQIYYGEALSANLMPFTVLLVTTIVLFGLAIKTFRWE